MKSKLVRIVAALAAIACLGTAAYFAGLIWSTEREYQKGDDSYYTLAKLVKEDPSESSDSSETDDGNNKGGDAADSEASENTDEESAQDINVDLAKQLNNDITAWLYCPDTVIDYPICHGDDNSYYLTHLADGTYNRNGCLFVDCKNSRGFSDDNTIIYGHHMASGKMFASLIKYKDQSYYEEHPIMYLTTEEGTYKIELFSGYVTEIGSSAYTMNFGTAKERAEWLKEISNKSDFMANAMTISSKDRIITLSTCAYDFQNARYVVHGKISAVN